MYLSMWILAESLKDYPVETHIMSGEMCIRSVSLLFSNTTYYPHVVYIGPSEDFIQTLPGKVFCVNKNDYFIVDCASVDEVFEKLMEAVDYYLEWDLNIRDRIDESCTLQEIVEKGADILRSLVGIMNAGFIIQAVAGKQYADHIPAESLSDLQAGEGIPMSHVTSYADMLKNNLDARSPYIFREPVLQLSYYTQNFLLNGWLWGFCFFALKENEDPSESRKQLFHVLNGQIHRWWEHSGMQAEQSEQSHIFLRLLKEDPSMTKEETLTYLDRIGWLETDEKHLCIIRERYGNSLIYSRLIHQISQTFSDCYVIEHEGYVILVINTSHLPIDILTTQLPVILYGSEIHIGISYPFRNVFHLPQYLEQAQIALEAAFQKNTRILMCSDCVISYTRNLIRKMQTVNLEHPLTKQIRRYDKEHGTEYYQTLKTYIMEERSIVRTAQALHIHKNTLLYRIQRLKDQFALNLDDREERFRLILNYMIYSEVDGDGSD